MTGKIVRIVCESNLCLLGLLDTTTRFGILSQSYKMCSLQRANGGSIKNYAAAVSVMMVVCARHVLRIMWWP